MYKHKLFLLPLALLLAFMALACAPPDDDDRSSGPSKPTINNAIYNVGTALLTVQGTDLSPTEAQIQTIVVAGLAFSSYTADDDATGVNSNDLAKGKYRIANDGTKLWLKLTDKHKATLNGKPGMGSDGLKKGLLTSTGTWAGLDTAKDLTVSGNPDPAITGASYHVGTAILTVQGSNLGSATQAQIQTITVGSRTNGVALSSYTADTTATGADSSSLAKGKYRIKSDGTAIWLYLTDRHKTTLNGKTGMDTNGLKDGLLTSTGSWAGLNTAKDLTVSGNPEITGASYHVGTAILTVQGSNLGSATQAQIQTITVGSRTNGVALSSYTADTTATGADSSSLAKGKYRIKSDGTAIWLYLTDQHKTTLNGKTGMDTNGRKVGLLTSTGAWAGLDTAKDLTVSGHPEITSASYHVGTAILTVQGSNLSPTEAQIQTIVVDGVALDSYTADATATGADSSSLAKGKYRIKSDGTAIWLYLTDRHKTTLNGKTGMDTNGRKVGLLSVGTGSWAGLNTAKDLTVSGNPAITGASYHVGTAILTVQGSNLSPTEAQIQTIVVDGVALDSYTADATATGADSSSLAKGKYRIKSDGTAIWLYLTDRHKTTLNGKTGMDSNGLKDGLLTSTGTWAGLDTAKDLTVSGNPAITSASYHVGTALLTLQGILLGSATQAQIQTITVDGVALDSYTADDDDTGPDSRGLAKGKYRMHSAGTALWLYLTDPHKAALNGKTGMDSNGLKKGLLTSSGTWAGLDTAKDLAVSGNPDPAITRATYHVGTALLTLQGTHLGRATQAQIQTITVAGIALSSYTADGTATGADSSSLAKGKYRMKSDGTALWLYLTDQHKTTLNGKTGMDSNSLKKGLLTSTGTWAGLNTPKDLAVSGNPPAIGDRSEYTPALGYLELQGSNLYGTTQAQIQTITVAGVPLDSYTPDAKPTGPNGYGIIRDKYRIKNDGTKIWIHLTGADKNAINAKPDMNTPGKQDDKLSVGTGTWAGLDTPKDLTISDFSP